MGGQAHRLPGWSTATSSNSRHHTLTHMTPISRPRNQQREHLPEGPGDRVENVMAMMMMSQAQDRDKRGGGMRGETPKIPYSSQDAASADAKSAEHDGYDYDEYDGSERFRFSSG